MIVTSLLPIASFVLVCLFWTALGAFLLTVVPGFQRTLLGVFGFLLGALAASFVVGRLADLLFSQPDGAPTNIPAMLVRFVIGFGSAVGGGLLCARLLQREWPKKASQD